MSLCRYVLCFIVLTQCRVFANCKDPTPKNGIALVLGGLTNGTFAQIDCNTGFNRIGHGLIFCDNGTWSDNITCEIAECGDPTPTFGSSNHTNTTYLATALIDCNPGYNRNGLSFIECQDDNSWSGTPTCLPMDCGDPTPSSGSANDTTYTYGAALEIECMTGYNIKGSSVIVCQTNGTWSDSPTCNPSDCLPPNVTNADTLFVPKGTTFGTLAILTCLEGYTMNGDAFVTCQENSMWSTLPSCDISDCGNPAPIANGNITLPVAGVDKYGDIANVSCDTGYNTSTDIVECLANGTWEPAVCLIEERLNVTMILLAILGGVVVMAGVVLIIIVVNILKSNASAPPGKLIHGQHVHKSV